MAFRQRYGALALHWIGPPPKKKKKKKGGGGWEKMNCPSTHATTTTPPLGWLRLRLLLHRCRAHLADQDVLSFLSALGRFFA